jgi:membrane protease YdiL (CAAX protease family)
MLLITRAFCKKAPLANSAARQTRNFRPVGDWGTATNILGMPESQLLDTSKAPDKRRLWAEIGIVLGLSLGASAVYSVIAIARRLSREQPLSQQTATLNTPLAAEEIFDLIYQLLGHFFALMPVALVCYLLWSGSRPRLGRLGLRFDRVPQQLGWGAVLALVIGIPGLAFYFAARALGITVSVVPTALDAYWWTVPVLLLSALRAGIVEEVIVIGYLFERLRQLGWGPWSIILSSAVLRGTYHLYQGFGAFIGNLAMGVLFGWLYTRYGRLLPLVAAHAFIDAAVFIGYPFAVAGFPILFNG